MQYHPPSGSTDPNAPYVGKNVAAGTLGSKVPPGMPEYTQREIVNAIAQSGQTPADTDLFQLTRAIRGGQLDFDATDIGTADAVICQVGLAHTAIAAGLPFTFIKGSAANTGNAVPTLTITDLSGNNGLTGTIVKSGGGALAKGDLPAGALITVRARAPGVFAVVSLLTISDLTAPVNTLISAAASSPTSVIQAAPRNILVFIASTTWTCPANVTRVRCRVWGGGGGGGADTTTSAGGSGGGGGGYTEGAFTVTPGTTYAITVGAGGLAGSNAGGAGNPGGAGGTSSFSSFATAAGGGGGPGAGSNTASPGGGGAGGQLCLTGANGGIAYIVGNSAYASGTGGAAPFGGGSPSPNVGSGGTSGNFPGGGANGSSANANGGTGGAGLIVLEI